LTFSNANTFTGGITLSNVPVTVGLGTAVAGNAAVIVTSSNGLGSGPITLDLSMMTTNAMTNTARAIEFNITGGGVIPNAIILPATTSGVTNLSLQGRDSSSVFTLSGQISGGFAGLTNWVDFGDAASSGVMRLANNANNFLGNIYGDRGVLAITGDGCLGNAANLVKLDQASVNGGLRFDGAAVNVAHALIANSAISLDVYGDNNGDGVAETANSSTISGIVGGGGAITVKCGVNITPASFGTLSLLGNNGFTGALTISSFVKAVAGHANALGTTAGGTTVNSGGTLSLNLGGTYASEGLTLNGSGVSGVGALENLSGADILNGNITLASSSSIGVTAGSLALGGVISGAFPLTKVGPGALTLSGANSYSAGTIINNGSLFVNGSLPVGNAVSVNGGTLAGVGTINAPVTSQIGSTLSPGVNTIGKLTVNSSVNLLGTAIMEVSKAASTNDSLAGISALYYGGTLTVSNLGGSYVAGDSFKLFSAQSYQGGFAATNLPNISPLTWVWTPANGTLSVVSGVNLTPTNIITTVTGNQLILSWPADHTGWTLQAQTNGIGTGLNSAWVSVPNSELNNGYTNTINPVNPTVFFRLYHP
jgi:autotransporter-associated beta strand protein